MANNPGLISILAAGNETFRRLNAGVLSGAGMPAKPPADAFKARMKQNRGAELNKTETAFLDYLRAIELKEWKIEPHALTFKIGNGVRYTPDLIASFGDSVRAYEVKGPHAWDDAIVKLKVAGAQFTWCAFWLASKDKRTGWRIERVMP